MSLPITSQRAAGRSRCDGVDPGVDREWLPVHPIVPFESASDNDWKEAGRAVPADKAECLLWVQKGDARRNAPQRARCAVNSRPPCRAKRLWNLGLARCNQVLGSFSTG